MLFQDSMQRGLPAAHAHLPAIDKALGLVVDANPETDPPGRAGWSRVRSQLTQLILRTILTVDAIVAAEDDTGHEPKPLGMATTRADVEAAYGAVWKVTNAHPNTDPPGLADWFEARQQLVQAATRARSALDAVAAAAYPGWSLRWMV